MIDPISIAGLAASLAGLAQGASPAEVQKALRLLRLNLTDTQRILEVVERLEEVEVQQHLKALVAGMAFTHSTLEEIEAKLPQPRPCKVSLELSQSMMIGPPRRSRERSDEERSVSLDNVQVYSLGQEVLPQVEIALWQEEVKVCTRRITVPAQAPRAVNLSGQVRSQKVGPGQYKIEPQLEIRISHCRGAHQEIWDVVRGESGRFEALPRD